MVRTPETSDPGIRSAASEVSEGVDRLAELLRSCRRLLVLTGAGCSTASGIPDYRDFAGNWKSQQPMAWRAYVSSHAARQRYWARSFHGWKRIEGAAPNPAHTALARLEARNRIFHVITQNVDSLHQRAGSREVTDLHGRLDTVHCLRCSYRTERRRFQTQLELLNPHWWSLAAQQAPDGDAEISAATADFQVPDCPGCGGILKPAVVFFGEAVPRNRVALTNRLLEQSDGLLIAGSSLMVWSGFRFARAAADRGIPLAAVNLGITRADNLLHLKLELPTATALPGLAAALD